MTADPNYFILVRDIPAFVEDRIAKSVALVTVYNWLKKGYHGLTLKACEVKSESKGRSTVQAVRRDSLEAFLDKRYETTSV